MPGTVFELTLDEAIALCAAAAADPEFLWYANLQDRVMLLAEAQRVVEAHAHEAARRCLAPVRCQPNLRLIQGDDHDRRRRRDLTDGRGR